MERAHLSLDELDPFFRVKERPKILSSTQWDQPELFHRLHWCKISSLAADLNLAAGRSSWSPTWSPPTQTNPSNFFLSLQATSRRPGHVIYAFFPIGTPSLSWPRYLWMSYFLLTSVNPSHWYLFPAHIGQNLLQTDSPDVYVQVNANPDKERNWPGGLQAQCGAGTVCFTKWCWEEKMGRTVFSRKFLPHA